MRRVISPRLIAWARRMSPETIRQLERLAARAELVGHVAAMADAHLSEGVAVGSVFATEHALFPAALGGDLGCGMAALPFSGQAPRDRAALERLLARLAAAIPVGGATHRGRGVEVPAALLEAALSTAALTRERARSAGRQLGTLGGGNHFVELDRDTSGRLWLMLHSGSRGLGGAIAAHHRRVAEALGGALDAREPAGAAYLADVAWALSFARASRDRMLEAASGIVSEELGVAPREAERIDVHHNFVACEAHGGRSLFVHRKGATRLARGERGLIPGSMGTASYVVRGLGEPEAYASCSHGAGRVLSRREARARLDVRALGRSMRRVVYDESRAAALVEEAPEAYRDIKEVLEDQADLVEPMWRLEPLAVLKG